MAAEQQALEDKLEDLRGEVGRRFDTVHNDMKDLTKALRDLVRLDGDLHRIQDSVVRIGAQVDDHEQRLRPLETSGAVQGVTVKHISSTQAMFLAAACSLFTGLLIWLLTHGGK